MIQLLTEISHAQVLQLSIVVTVRAPQAGGLVFGAHADLKYFFKIRKARRDRFVPFWVFLGTVRLFLNL